MNNTPSPRLRELLWHCARACGTTLKELQSRDRHQPLAWYRHIAIEIARRHGYTSSAIMEALGQRDRSGTTSSQRTVRDALEIDRKARAELYRVVLAVDDAMKAYDENSKPKSLAITFSPESEFESCMLGCFS